MQAAEPVPADLAEDLKLITELAQEAGTIGMKWFKADPQVWMKEGQSPVSEADFAIDSFLKEKLLQARPDYGWLSEETDDDEERLKSQRTFIVDPIDGTRGFINGMDRWCVSIALVEARRPTIGVLECPAMGQTIVSAHGLGTTVNRASTRSVQPVSGRPIRVTGPRNLEKKFDRVVAGEIDAVPFVPSLAYRIAMVAQGDLHLALARASAKDWDLAAADLILHEAGGRLTDMEGETLSYNCRDVRHGALVAAHRDSHNEMLDLARQAMDNPQEQ